MYQSVLIIGFLAMAFGWFGSNTAFGRRVFPVKLAIIPIGALVIGTLIFARGLLLFVRRAAT